MTMTYRRPRPVALVPPTRNDAIGTPEARPHLEAASSPSSSPTVPSGLGEGASADDWRALAACLGHPAKLWFPDPGRGQGDEGVAICQGCPVREECLEHSLELPEEHGTWGGVLERHRRAMIKERRRRRRATR